LCISPQCPWSEPREIMKGEGVAGSQPADKAQFTTACHFSFEYDK
jgi:hypothetical protein